VLSKVAEIVVMLAGMVGFYFYDIIGLGGMLCVLFFMGLQSTFFGPAKYGILPEMLRGSDLPRANGTFLMLTFLAIIFGTATAGLLLRLLDDSVWVASAACVVIAIVGTATSLLIRAVPTADQQLEFNWRACIVPPEMVALLRRDSQLLKALVVASVFWMVGGIVTQTVNALGKTQLGLDDMRTSILGAMIGVGIALGCLVGGYFSRQRINSRVVVLGAAGVFCCLAILSLVDTSGNHLLGYMGSLPMLGLLGVFTGMFIVPIQVLLQIRPPKEEKGRMIALMNQASWIGIILGAIIFKACILVLDATGGPRCAIFAVCALIMAPVALKYRPQDQLLN
jgi:acyl-[acyl-carrier-protein]-phospholipid O-acyltransferase/long-chain-fatty-acid--[acyl-carrier-protein] ligase